MDESPASGVASARKWLLAALPLVTVLILPSAVEPFMLPKFTAIVLLALALLAVFGWSAVVLRSFHVPTGFVAYALTAFVIAALIAAVSSTRPWTSIIGWNGRYTGLASYLAYGVVFLTALCCLRGSTERMVRRGVLLALGGVVAYGLLQAVGADPVDWAAESDVETASFLGNINFTAAWVGAAAALALATALDRRETRGWRWVAGPLALLSFGYAALTGTSQGVVVVLGGFAWVGLTVATREGGLGRRILGHSRRLTLGTLGAVAAVAGVGIVLALPTVHAQLDQAFVERPEFWRVALELWQDHPIVGTGLDTYGHYFGQYRSEGHALLVGAAGADAPHSVFLGMLSNGGLLLGLTYLTFVLFVGVTLVRGLWTTQGASRFLLAGWGGVWLGYQAQALVSYDVPPLAVLHWLSAAVIVSVAAPPRWLELRLPGKAPVRARARGREYGPVLVSPATRILQGATVLATLVLAWLAVYPLRADISAASAAELGRSGQLDAATERLEKAASLNPAEPSYPLLVAQAEQAAGRHEASFDAAVEAAERDPGDVQAALYAGWQAQQLQDQEAASYWYQEAAQRDPQYPALLVDVAAYFAANGEPERARRYVTRALAIDPTNEKARKIADGTEAAGRS